MHTSHEQKPTYSVIFINEPTYVLSTKNCTKFLTCITIKIPETELRHAKTWYVPIWQENEDDKCKPDIDFSCLQVTQWNFMSGMFVSQLTMVT